MVSEAGALWDVASGDTGILGPSMRTATGEASKPFLFVQMKARPRRAAVALVAPGRLLRPSDL